MNERIELDVDTTEADRKIDALDGKITVTGEKLIEMGDDVERETKKSFQQVVGMMRASYMMVSGIAQVTGGSMEAIFSSMFSIAISAIGTYQSIAAAMAAVPGGQIQAAMMTISLATSVASLIAGMAGQEEMARRISGLNMALQGIGGMINNLNFL